MTPLVSIIIPNYNRGQLLRETLDSVINQTYISWEVIVVDDNSTDNSLEILRQYSHRDSRIQFYSRESGIAGGCVCRNEGIKKSKGEFIIFLDSDDLLAPFCLEKRVNTVKKFPEYDFWVFSTLEFNKIPGDSDILINVFTKEDCLNRFLRMDVIWLATGPFWRKDTLIKMGGWDERLKSGQDWDLSTRALIDRFRFLYLNDVDNYYRISSDNKVSDNNSSAEHLELRVYLFSKIFELLKLKNRLSGERKKIIRDLFISYIIHMAAVKNYRLLRMAINREKELFPERKKAQMLTHILIKLYKIGLGRNRVPAFIKYVNSCETKCNTFRKVRYQIPG